MITHRHLFTYVSSEPFRPFRIKMNSGETFEIRHPEMIAVSRSTAHVYRSIDVDDKTVENEREISIMLIESIEPLQPTVASGDSADLAEK